MKQRTRKTSQTMQLTEQIKGRKVKRKRRSKKILIKIKEVKIMKKIIIQINNKMQVL